MDWCGNVYPIILRQLFLLKQNCSGWVYFFPPCINQENTWSTTTLHSWCNPWKSHPWKIPLVPKFLALPWLSASPWQGKSLPWIAKCLIRAIVTCFDAFCRYYGFDKEVIREILGRKMSAKLRKDMDDVSEKTGIPLKRCRRQVNINHLL